MAIAKSPFMVFQDFISPLQCEEIISDLGFNEPDTDKDGYPIKMSRHSEKHEEDLYHRFQVIADRVFNHYGCEYRATEKMQFEYLAEGVKTEPECANSQYLRKKWVKTRDRDIVGFLFLSDYCDNEYFDGMHEVYGGKLEFPQHAFGFEPERGTLILCPADPHFIYANAPVIVGDLFQVKLNFAAKEHLIYQPADFPGVYTTWFK